MKRHVFALLFLLLPLAAPAETLVGRVVSIGDGDSLTLVDAASRQHPIRIAGIDAPERNQDFGQRSRTALSALALNQNASADCRQLGRDQLLICLVSVAGKDLGLEQLRQGMAWYSARYALERSAQELADYQHAEFLAKIHRYGLWNSKNPAPPWEWRRNLDDD